MTADSALVKFKMVNGLISSILEENRISLRSLFPKLPEIDAEVKSKIEKLLESRERIRVDLDEADFDDFTDDLNLANYFLACKKFPESLRYYESALVKNPQSYSALCNKGLCLFKISRLDEALACYDEALKTYKNIPEAFFMKGKIMYIQQNFAEAIIQFHNSLDLEPENLDVKHYLGKTLLKSGNIEDATKTLESIVENHDHTDSLLQLGQIFSKENNFKKVSAYLDKLLEISPNHIEAHLLLGKSYVLNNYFNEAISHFEKILSKSPNHIEAHLLLGKTFIDLTNFNDAFSHFEKILELSPNHMDALNSKILVLEKMGKIDEAVDCCDQIAKSSPDPTDSILKKGILLFNSNKSSNALAIFNAVLEKTKTNNVALLYKAKIYSQKQEFHEALLCIDTILKLDPKNPDALENAVELSLKVGNYENALSCIDQLLSESPLSDSLLIRKSRLLSILGLHEESGQICMTILQHDTTNVDALYELGKIHSILNNYEKAIELFDGALEKNPLDSNIIFKKSIAFFALQKYDVSILCLEQIAETDILYNFAQYQKSKIHMLQGNTKQSFEILSKIIKSNEVFRLLASNEIIFESISDTPEFMKLIKEK